MPDKKFVSPDYLFEVSWEVCNKVGGIHTVIATKALNLSKEFQNNHILIGPDVWRETEQNPEFIEDTNLLRAWRVKAASEGLRIRVGRWNVSGKPVAILVDFTQLLPKKDEIFTELWKRYGLDSISGQWDYIESSLFGYATGKVIESFVKFNLSAHHKAVAQFHEWMTGTGVLYLKSINLPIATVFTTHATVVGRAVSGNNLPLYSSLTGYNPEDKAREFNVSAKHSLEKIAARECDAFTTVSQITSNECSHFLGKTPDILTPNGFENSFTPKEGEFKICSKTATKKLMEVANAMLPSKVSPDAVMVGISGRYEYKNKGIDVYLDALDKLNRSNISQEVIAWIFVPAGQNGPNRELLSKLNSGGDYTTNITHYLMEPEWDPVLKRITELKLNNLPQDKVKVLFVPSYLNGNDSVFNLTYYQILCGLNLTLFPSYYEPWGYTPLESLAFGVPTVTTSLAGFGLWVRDHFKGENISIDIIDRDDTNYHSVVDGVANSIMNICNKSKEQRMEIRENAKEVSKIALWDNQVEYYKQAWSIALGKVIKDRGAFPASVDEKDHISFRKDVANTPNWSRVIVNKKLPERLKHLETLTKNLWWCWNQEAIELFEMVSGELCNECDGNPILMLDKLSLQRYYELERDEQFLEKLDRVYDSFSKYISRTGDTNLPKVAYFSMEYGLDKSLKIYSGGLGVLAGDYLKEASDMMVPMTAVGLLYRYGYFTQKLSAQGDQVAVYEAQDFTKLSVTPVRDSEGNWVTVSVALPGRNMTARLWKAHVGVTELILLDTDHEDNLPEDRGVTHHLYGGDWENRLKQEMLLGIGGVRALRALNVEAEVYHLNEGHAAFIGLERMREYIQNENLAFSEALEVIRSSSLFTTHTPVPAGHDAFSEELLRGYLSHYPSRFNISWEVLVSLGKIDPSNPDEKFSMSNLAANMSQEINGVSWLHGEVSRDILSPLWPGYLPEELHVGYVTNGVHYPTWTAPEWKQIHSKVFGEDFGTHHYNKECFNGIYKVDSNTIWYTRNKLRSKLILKIKESLSQPSTTTHYTPQQIVQIKDTIREDILTIGFARRFATYKRAHLLFRDLKRLEKIVNDPLRPVQFIYAGKAHPADKAGQDLIKRIVEVSLMPQFIGKIIFLPGYDMTLAKYLVQGVDVWMNTPTRPMEASGTSGEKAVMNGVMHFSVLDGWWVEGYVKGAGWALPIEKSYDDDDFQNELDAATIYNMLENEIAPLYYNKSPKTLLPEGWIETIRNTVSKVASNFTTNRMMTDYIQKYYSKLAKRNRLIIENDYLMARELASWKKRVRREWPYIEVLEYIKPDNSRVEMVLGEEYISEVTLSLGDLSADDIGVEMILAKNGTGRVPEIKRVYYYKLVESTSGTARYRCVFQADTAGAFEIAGRIYANNIHLPHRQDFDLVKWL